MPRPPKVRSIQGGPRATLFKPSGIPAHLLETVVLGLDELEAIRLADLEGLYQEQAAACMQISRPTFGRLLAQAHGKVATALLHGKALVFEGGAVFLGNPALFECGRCGERWQVPARSRLPGACAVCGSSRVSGLGPAPGAAGVPPGVSAGLTTVPATGPASGVPSAAQGAGRGHGWGGARGGHGGRAGGPGGGRGGRRRGGAS